MNSPEQIPAKLTGWEEAELNTLQEGARLSFRERLLWLQDMLEFADRFCGTASGRKLDRDGNIVPVVQSRQSPGGESLPQLVAEEQEPYPRECPPASPPPHAP